jgi:hypothetical protein
MSKRPIVQKKLAKLRKSLRDRPDTHIDIVSWLRDRRYAQTAGEAKKLILDGRLFADGRAVGIGEREVPKKIGAGKLAKTLQETEIVPYVERLQPAYLRHKLTVKA